MPRGKTTGKRPDGRYMFQATHPISKKRYTVYGNTRKEALAKLDALKASFKAGLPAPDEQQTIETYLNTWLKTMSSQVDESTWLAYEGKVRVHLIPAFGSLYLPELTSLMIQNFYNDKTEAGLAAATIRHMHAVLHHALDDAVRLQLVEKNAAHYAKPPRPAKHTVKALSEEQTRAFLEAAAQDRLYALFLIAAKVGLRESELTALHWAEINLPGRLLTVKYGFQRSKHAERGYKLDDPKSDYSSRTITLPRSAVTALEVHRERQRWEKKRTGAAYQDVGLVFSDEIGRYYTPRQVRTRFDTYVALPEEKQRKTNRGPKPMQERKPVLPEGTTFHQLRKTANTRLVERGVDPKTSAAIMGHGVGISLDIYTAVTPRMKEHAADVMDEDEEYG